MTRLHFVPVTDMKKPRSGWVVFVAAMGAFLDGFDLVIIAGALIFIKPELGLTPAETGLVGSIVFVGMVAGALVFGRLTDRIGRNTSFALVLGLFVVGSAVSAFAHEPWVLILGRLIVGLGIGADLPVSTTLIAEALPANKRGRGTGLMQVFWFGGATVSGIVGILLYLALGESSWRWMLGSAIVLAIIVMVLRRGMSESPQWVAAHESQQAAEEPKNPLSELLRNPLLRSALLFSCLFWFLMTVRGAGFNLYTPTFLSEVGLSGVVETLGLSIIINLVYTVAALFATIYLDKLGRRTFVLASWAAATLFTLSLVFVDEGNAVLMFVLITVSAIPIQLVAVAAFPLSVEPFPTMLRGTAQGMSSAAGKFGGFLSAFAFPVALAGLGWTNMAVLLVSIMALGLVAGLFLRFPETRGVELEDVERQITAADRR